ncbi:MAG: ABC transporter ATP-binding protein [Anaerolineae bacterium]|nr:ABC transporter ATP-binding protein [Anaerolineae bacterium]MCO5192147.1 ABC transporter ATP-binding protein [Anaerolineae bacterium]MCO5199912.1 ABC transporter ATP-binding protein [Anaerolineae bacterium]
MSAQTLIQFKQITKTYQMGEVQVHALQNMNVEITDGEFIVIVGPSGSGKTTTLNLLGGLDSPTSGELIISGTDVAHYDEKALTTYRRDKIGFIFQFFNLLPTLTARENVEFALELVESNGTQVQDRALNLLEKVGLAERADHFPSQLSGGEQQRTAIARALAKNPLILLADEPTGNLDFRVGRKVLRVMQDLNRQDGRTVVLVTHNTAIGQIGDRVIHLRDGNIAHIDVNEKPLEAEAIEW